MDALVPYSVAMLPTFMTPIQVPKIDGVVDCNVSGVVTGEDGIYMRYFSFRAHSISIQINTQVIKLECFTRKWSEDNTT